jgi:glycopeptide antibiotics resistance protein
LTSQTRLGIVLSVCVILAAHVDAASWRGAADWARVSWVPFVSPPVRLRDILQNVLLFVPFGYFFALGCGTLSRWGRAAAVLGVSASLSTLLEILQLFMPERFPSTTDIVCNVAGAAIGMALLLIDRPALVGE